MFENFSERLADGTLKAEPLSHVVSLFEEEQQDAKRPDPTRQYNLQLDSKLTITTKRRHLSSEPTDEKGLRLKYSILTNLWLLAQMRQPGRSIYADFDRNTSIDFLETLLDKDNFNFYKEVDGRPIVSPSWTYCLSYELELRKEAIRLCKEQSFGIQSALWSALRNTEHRMKHWLQLVAIQMLHHHPAVRNSSPSRNGFLVSRKHALAHHDGAIRNNSRLPAVLRCSLFLLLLVLHTDRKVAKTRKEVVPDGFQLTVQAKFRVPRISIIL